jgi:hypothetical protein
MCCTKIAEKLATLQSRFRMTGAILHEHGAFRRFILRTAWHPWLSLPCRAAQCRAVQCRAVPWLAMPGNALALLLHDTTKQPAVSSTT